MEIAEGAREMVLAQMKKPETIAAATAYLAALLCGDPRPQRTWHRRLEPARYP